MSDLPLTPAVVVDLAKAEANIFRFQAYADRHGLAVRPHIKTHKLGLMAALQLAAGAVGITCQKVSEAEAMVDASPAVQDAFLTYNILGEERVARLRRLAERITVSTVADDEAVVAGLARGFAGAAAPLSVLVECNTGAQRCGVSDPAAACRLALAIAASPGLRFGGLMTYPPVGGEATVQAFMTEAKRLIAAEGLGCERISSGGTPGMWHAHVAPVATEYRPGTYVYNDRSLIARGVATMAECALTVEATIVSRHDGRAVIDAGSKVLTSDLLGLEGHGLVVGHPDIAIHALSEEHGHLSGEGLSRLKVGDRLSIIPNHACVVSNMLDAIYLRSPDGSLERTIVDARGAVV
ncbi:alanine racemase [Aurantimonas sp. A2-1-M11]|uniref:alanine racemase n=1 Tax=Aurantimonas sp. A2-1-M11 TaxID=3113712 RepID=UPI002F91F73E